ncbi:MAG: FHA domain-containing protein [Armatimonadota bacterium]|nr:FHA domain-containing protein [Armatimonadota bacterium]
MSLRDFSRRFGEEFRKIFDHDNWQAVMNAVEDAMIASSDKYGGERVHSIYVIHAGERKYEALPTVEQIKERLTDRAEEEGYEFAGPLEVHIRRISDSDELDVKGYLGDVSATKPRLEAALLFEDGDSRVEIPGDTKLCAGSNEPALAFDMETTEYVVLVPNPSGDVSRRHARIWMVGHHDFRIEDLGSTNGTWVNTERVSADTKLQYGDEIQLGSVRLTFDRLLPVNAVLRSASGLTEPIEQQLSNDRSWRIGRDASCEIQIPSYAADVSNLHAEVAPGPGGYWLRDTGSRNGTFLKRTEERIDVSERGEVRLRDGDEFVLGGEVVLTYSEE